MLIARPHTEPIDLHPTEIYLVENGERITVCAATTSGYRDICEIEQLPDGIVRVVGEPAQPQGVPVEACLPMLHFTTPWTHRSEMPDASLCWSGVTYGECRRFLAAVEAAQRGEQPEPSVASIAYYERMKQATERAEAERDSYKKEAAQLREDVAKLRAAIEKMRPLVDAMRGSKELDGMDESLFIVAMSGERLRDALKAFDAAMGGGQ